ncbi:MAG: phosphoribosylformylglycinamidine synthase [Firmicutes bacterium]|nr:phosphoribosylformylglycinamidine synthase [Bacillota bacterium]
MVYRVYSEKKKEFAHEANALLSDARRLLGIGGLTDVRVINRYDAEGIRPDLFEYAKTTVFSEPQVDVCSEAPDLDGARVFAVEFLPGQFDQRADSAAQCIQLISQEERPLIRSAKVYALYGNISDAELAEIKKYVINPVEAREASLDLPETLAMEYAVPDKVAVLDGFNGLSEAQLADFIKANGLAMDLADIKFCQDYFKSEDRCPTITEIKVIDTYWSDHCRHTTFGTILDSVSFEDPLLQRTWDDYLAVRKELGRTKPICLMDLGTIGAKYLKAHGKLDKLDESEEINACTVKLQVEIEGKKEPWLLLFKNETHNHPTEIEPFGGAATCIGGAIRDPLSGRSYVYAAMRVTGAADPTVPISETIPGKLPQRKLVATAAAGYSSYGNQIGLATGIVDELYHPGYAAKHMEIGAVIAAAPEANVRRERPEAGDVVILLGGSTGRDGIGGATGSSKAHDVHSVENCGAEVQKGNAPEERKLQRLFRNPAASRLIKRCNDFGAGGVSVAIGELADGLSVDLNAVPKKYEGLDGTELAISESQERMAVVVAAGDKQKFLDLAAAENLQAIKVAEVTEDPRLVLNWNGEKIVDLSREFLNSNGAEKHIDVEVKKTWSARRKITGETFAEKYIGMAESLNCCSRRGLSERFDSTIGAGTVLMPFGGKNQLTPVQAMVHKISVEDKDTDTCSVMSWGYNPFLTESSPYHGAYTAVVESVSKLVATGAEFKDVYLTFQEYFEKLGHDSEKWGKPLAALLGAFRAQKELGVAAIGGKDSMSGSFEDIHVPPTLVSFAVTDEKIENIMSPEFKEAGSSVLRISPRLGKDGLPEASSLLDLFRYVNMLQRCGAIKACWAPSMGGTAEAIFKMCIGNGLGFRFEDGLAAVDSRLFNYDYGSFIVELGEAPDGIFSEKQLPDGVSVGFLGRTTDDGVIRLGEEEVGIDVLTAAYEGKLEDIYNCNIKQEIGPVENVTFKADKWPAPLVKSAKPRILIPVFPGTNCEYDSAKAAAAAGLDPEIMVIRNLSADDVSRSVEKFAKAAAESQIIFIPGGFSGGDEPEGSAKFITAFFRNGAVKEQVTKLLEERDGLMLGICNGFQALVKLGLVPYGKIMDTDADSPTLTFNVIARHQSKIVRTRIASNKSPWLALTQPGEIYSVPISHGEGRFIANDAVLAELIKNGQIATQYVDLDGDASADVRFNPNGSVMAIEGITSPDGRVLGKMGHSERVGAGLYRNVPGDYDIKLFAAAKEYFK